MGLCFAFGFHQKRLTEAKNQQKLLDVITEITGARVRIDCTVDKDAANKKPGTAATPVSPAPVNISGDSLTTISNIFGDAQLLE